MYSTFPERSLLSMMRVRTLVRPCRVASLKGTWFDAEFITGDSVFAAVLTWTKGSLAAMSAVTQFESSASKFKSNSTTNHS